MNKEQIMKTLEARPDIKELFDVIFSFPEEQRSIVARIATDVLELRKLQGSSES